MFGLPQIEPVYLDYAASTPIDADVAAQMLACLSGPAGCANPSSSHAAGELARAAIDQAADALAESVGLRAPSVIWTSGATESDNLAIIGAARYRAHEGRHLITTTVEHKAVLDPFKYLERSGFEVTWLQPGHDGCIDAAQLADALRDDTTLVSTMWVNNELGSIADIEAIAVAMRAHRALWHVDAAQAWGKLALEPARLGIDLLSVTAHKAYGPKGVGALIVTNSEVPMLEPLLYGGGQQRALRPGTPATHQIVGFGATARRVLQQRQSDMDYVAPLADALLDALLAVPGVTLNGSRSQRLAGIINVRVDGVDGRSLLAAMSPVAVSAGSACNSTYQEPSFVLRAIGLSDHEAQASLRFSLGRSTTAAEVEIAADRFVAAVARLREIGGPLSGVSAADVST
ncbi:MAG: cysteine desulfurase family protein [Pseudomonadota bacterium]